MKINTKHKIKIKVVSALMLAALVIPQIIQSIWSLAAMAAELPVTVATTYFSKQLNDGNERIFYDNMTTMLNAGYFKQGDVIMEVYNLDIDKSNEALLNDMGAARDAFLLDHPDLFYVDFDYLSLSISEDADGAKHIYLGTGRDDTYLNKEFLTSDGKADTTKINNAINTVNNRINAIVAEANGKSRDEQIKIAHDAVARAAKYTLEYQSQKPYTVRTVYGVFGLGNANDTGQAVCEGYARALKAILDRLGIPAILVRGVYMDKTTPQEHMWLYAQRDDGKWYGVDATFDNTDKFYDGVERVSSQYLLVSADGMPNHYPTGIISSSDREFTYPELDAGVTESSDPYDENAYEKGEIVYKDPSGLLVTYAGKDETVNGKTQNAVYHISYNGKSYTQAAEDGNYIIINSWQKKPNLETNKTDKVSTGWLYTITDTNAEYPYEDHPEAGYVSVGVIGTLYGFQVGITKSAPKEDGNDKFFYTDPESNIYIMSDAIETGNDLSEYAQPFIRRSTPSVTTKQLVGRTYHVAVEYDQEMGFEENNTTQTIGTEVLLHDLVYGYRNASENMSFTITEPKLADDKRTITFDFTPSRLWSLDETAYIIKFTGIKGLKSGKAPNTVSYVVFNQPIACIYQLRDLGLDMEAYGKPTLMDDFDIADIVKNGTFKDADNDNGSLGITDEFLEQYGDLLKHRLALVTTTTTPEEAEGLESLLNDYLENNPDGKRELAPAENGKTRVETYNIELSLCLKQLENLKDGVKIRIKLGFPEGYGPKDAGVTFKAYHYKNLGNGQYEVEEINCIVTELGLILEVDSFSPFAIAALKKDDAKDIEKSIVLQTTKGGVILDADKKRAPGTIFIKNAEDFDKEYFYTAVADEGYKIVSLTITDEDGTQRDGLAPAIDTIANDDAEDITSQDFTVKPGAIVQVDFGKTKLPSPSPNPNPNPSPSPNPDPEDPSTPNAPNSGIVHAVISLISNQIHLVIMAAVLTGIGTYAVLRRKKTA